MPRARELPQTSASSQLKRSNSLARLKAAALDLETELSRKETHEHELELQVADAKQEAQVLRGRVQALEAELAGAKAAARLGVERARLAHEVLQEEQDAFLALLLDDHEVELSQLKAERDEALGKAALAEHKQLRGHDPAELERRLTWLRGECDEARREVEECRREADDARAERDRARTQRDAAVEEAERLRSLLGANVLRQRPTQPELSLDLPHGAPATEPQRDAAPGTPTPRGNPQVAPTRKHNEFEAGHPTATAIPVAMAQARAVERGAASSSPPASPRPATLPPATVPRPRHTADEQADHASVSQRQGARTAPAVPQHGTGIVGAVSRSARAFELDTVPPPAESEAPGDGAGSAGDVDLFAAVDEPGVLSHPHPSDALDMTRDLDWGAPHLRQAQAPQPERKTARPVGPADQPPVVVKKPTLARSPGGYSMPDDASGTIEVLTPLGSPKR